MNWFTFFGIIFISVFGTMLHFLYDISNHNKFVGLFAAVNESTWEHIKIALTATFIWSLFDGFVFGDVNNYFFSKVVSILVLIIFIPLLFYGFKWIIGKSYLFVDIMIFYITIVISQIVFMKLLTFSDVGYIVNYVSLILMFMIFGFYMVLTLMPIKNLFFKDPITKKYGVNGHFHHSHKNKV